MSNDSSDLTGDEKLLPRVEGIGFFIGYVLESVAIIVANTVTIIIFTRDRKLKQAKFYLLINLAVADLLVGVACAPIWIYNLAFAFDLWPPPTQTGMIWRRFVPEMTELFVKYASLVTLTMIAAERMFATFLPTNYRLLKRRTHYAMIGICWVFAALLPLNYFATAHLQIVQMEVSVYIMLAITCVLLLATCVSYFSIWVKIKFGGRGLTSAREVKLTTSLFLVTVVSLTTWLPSQAFFSVFMVGMIRGHQWFSMDTFNRVTNATALLLLANSLVNPIIYAFRIPQFRHNVVQLCCRRSRKRSTHEELKLEENPDAATNP